MLRFTGETIPLLADGQKVGGAEGGAVGGAVEGEVGGAVGGAGVGAGVVPPQAGIVAGVHSPAVEQKAYKYCKPRFVA